MTNLESGHIQTGNNSPTGAKKQIEIDNPYFTKDDFVATSIAQGLNFTASHPLYISGEIDKLILRASANINRKMNMYVDTQTIDETKTAFTVRPYNPQLTTVVVNNRPYTKINRCWIQVLKWFVEVDVSSTSSYIQDFYEYGYFKIVPLLSSSGQGAGSLIPSNIIDRIALGVLWYNYTFGYGTPLTSQTLSVDSTLTIYQAPLGNRLFAPSQTLNVYKNGVIVPTTQYTVNYPNGIVTFTSANLSTDVITADFTTNQSIPADIQEAAMLLLGFMLGQDLQNALGADSYSIQTYSVNFGGLPSRLEKRIDELLGPYKNKTPKFI